jgi:hypothetical protein
MFMEEVTGRKQPRFDPLIRRARIIRWRAECIAVLAASNGLRPGRHLPMKADLEPPKTFVMYDKKEYAYRKIRFKMCRWYCASIALLLLELAYFNRPTFPILFPNLLLQHNLGFKLFSHSKFDPAGSVNARMSMVTKNTYKIERF